MPIKYSLNERKTPAGQNKVEGKLYAMARHNGVLSAKEFTERMCRRYRSLDPVQVQAVLEAVAKFLRTELLEGYRVQLEPLGTFSVSLESCGSTTSKNFARTNIKDVKVNWRPAKDLRDLKKDAKFRLVEPLKTQQQALQLDKSAPPSPK